MIDMKRLKFGSKIKVLKDPTCHFAKIGDIGTIAKANFFHDPTTNCIFDKDGFIWIETTGNPDSLFDGPICIFHRGIDKEGLDGYIKVLKY